MFLRTLLGSLTVGAVLLAACGGASSPSSDSQSMVEDEDAGCLAKTCTSGMCGTMEDGCGTRLDCGGCGGVETCGGGGAPNHCGAPASGAAALSLVGRYDSEADGGVSFAYPGGGIDLRFYGRELTLHMKDVPDRSGYRDRLGVSIDGAAFSDLKLDPQRESYVLASGLEERAHSVRVVKRTESVIGTVHFLGFDYGAGGSLLPPAPLADRRILFVGDSITAGYGVLGADQHCSFSDVTEDHLASFAWLAATELNALPSTAAYSGKGVFRNIDGTTTSTMVSLFDRALPDVATSNWQHAEFSPSAVVVLLGTNDFIGGVPDKTAFLAAFRSLTSKIRTAHPAAHVVIALTPMLSDYYPQGQNQRTVARGYLQELVQTLNGAGDANVSFLEFDVQDGTDGYGCDWHPSQATHQKMSAKLVAHLKQMLGW